MLPRLTALLLLSFASALADSAPKTPFGSTILPADTRTWRCESGRTVVSFSPNTQSIQFFYQGKVHRLTLLPATRTEKNVGTLRYAEISLLGDTTFDQPRTGRGLEWVTNLQKPRSAGLWQVSQPRNGQRQHRAQEYCWQTQP